jgi:hypothetical protein
MKCGLSADFLDLGSRDAVDKALQHLTAAGQLRRPGFNKLMPDPRSAIEALGLTNAHSDARRRALRLGNVTISFHPTGLSLAAGRDEEG